MARLHALDLDPVEQVPGVVPGVGWVKRSATQQFAALRGMLGRGYALTQPTRKAI